MKIQTILVALLMAVTTATAQTLPYQDRSLSAQERAKDLCGRLTIEEKTALMMDQSPAVERLGIPAFHWWSEALHGVGRNGFATVFPATIGMAASFDDALLYRVFTAVSDEARAKNTQARQQNDLNRYQGLSFWTPNINIFRDPRWGRGQETYGEDPYLTTRMGLAVVAGLQGEKWEATTGATSLVSRSRLSSQSSLSSNPPYKKLLACAKHFAVHSGPEWNRHSFNVDKLPPRDLWETYLPAFKSLVQEGKVAEVMCAYQQIDGEPCCGNARFLQQILRKEWGFKGVVVSDCGAINDFWMPNRHNFTKTASKATARAVRAGTDVECGSQYKTLTQALQDKDVTMDEVDSCIVRLLTARFELGDFDSDELNPWAKIPQAVIACKEHKQLALQMARESIVLLKNNGILPLNLRSSSARLQSEAAQKASSIVIMGPNATDSVMQWANYSGYPTATSTILQGIREKLGNVKYVQGCGHTRNEVEESRFNLVRTPDGKVGMKATYWNNTTMEGQPIRTMTMSEPICLSNGGATVFAPGVNLEQMSARYEGSFTPRESETVTFTASFDDGVRLMVNGDTLIDVWKSRARIQYKNIEMAVEKGKRYDIIMEYFQKKDLGVLQFDIVSKKTPTQEQILAAVGNAETVIFVGGISPRLEGEEMKVSEPGFKGGDRTDIELPQAQRDVIALLHNAGKKVIFVNCSGSAIAMVPEVEHADAIVQAWYPGEQGGKAVADVLTGAYNPSGKLPITFYKSVNDLPDFLDYRMANRTYRYFTGEPLFPFGYGLSYTTFKIKASEVKDNKLMVDVTNTGKREGTEVVQLYIRKKDDTAGPLKTLRGFQRVTLQPGETKTVSMNLIDTKTLETWDKKSNTMRMTGGTYEVMVGHSSSDKDLKRFEIEVGKQ